MTESVAALIAKTRPAEGEEEFAAWVAANQRRVFQIAYGVLRDAADAEEVAQDAFLRAYRKLYALRDPAKFRAWVCRIAFRLALNRYRGRRRQLERDTAWQAENAEAAACGARSAEQQMFLARLRREIGNLPEKLRLVLLLCAVEEMDTSDVAATLGIPQGTVRSRLHLARKRLLGALEP